MRPNPDMAASQREDWATPQDLFRRVSDRWGPFDLDPCATAATAKAPEWFCLPFTHPDRSRWDGLIRPWFGRVFVNPPYGKILGRWIWKCHDEAHRPGVVCIVALVPARTDTAWFHDFVLGRAEIEFLRGRVTFAGAPNPAPFPSMLCIWGG